MTILYFHGFDSGPKDEIRQFSEYFPGTKVIAPRLGKDYKQNLDVLSGIVNGVHRDEDLHIIGKSLGGFYVMLLSTRLQRDDVFYHAINPAFSPEQTLAGLAGKVLANNFARDKHTIQQDFMDELAALKGELMTHYNRIALIKSTYYLETEDELLDFSTLADFLYSFQFPTNILYAEQNHGFSDLSLVVNRIKELSCI